LAQGAGCTVETIRYYEREGLIPEPARSEGNYRLYDGGHQERLTFIRNCRALEMTLDEIRLLLGLKDLAGHDCSEVNALLDKHIGHVAERIARLQRLEGQLIGLREQCRRIDSVEECAILRELSGTGGEGAGHPDRAPEPDGCTGCAGVHAPRPGKRGRRG
jgi:Cd(II)/Pb(II)-responsive transcriptional regulator